LDLVDEEVPATVSLDALDRERHLFDDLVDKEDRVDSRAAVVQGQHAVAGTVIDKRILVQARSALAGIPLHSVSRDRRRVACIPCLATVGA